ncbi:MAG: hypothetical protein AB2L07_10270 [Thermoanaerobaculaceae bacterium]
MKNPIVTVALTLVCIASANARAEMNSRRDPTAGASVVAYRVTIGATMKDDGHATELFASDSAGYAEFERRATKLVEEQLRSHGMRAVPESESPKERVYLMIGFWGHRVDSSSCPETYVYYFSAKGIEHTQADTFEDTWEISWLGSAGQTQLQETMLRSLRLALDDYLSDRPASSQSAPPN